MMGYSAEFKAKVMLEVLEGNETFNQIASKYELLRFDVHKRTVWWQLAELV